MKFYDKTRKGEETNMAGFSMQIGGKLNAFLSVVAFSSGCAIALGVVYLIVKAVS